MGLDKYIPLEIRQRNELHQFWKPGMMDDGITVNHWGENTCFSCIFKGKTSWYRDTLHVECHYHGQDMDMLEACECFIHHSSEQAMKPCMIFIVSLINDPTKVTGGVGLTRNGNFKSNIQKMEVSK